VKLPPPTLTGEDSNENVHIFMMLSQHFPFNSKLTGGRRSLRSVQVCTMFINAETRMILSGHRFKQLRFERLGNPAPKTSRLPLHLLCLRINKKLEFE